MKYVVFKNGSKQYKASEGQELVMDKLESGSGAIEFGEVVLVSDEGKVTMGTPYVTGARVHVSVVGEEKGEKVRVSKYKAKSRYHKTIGHRAKLTRVKVEKIALS